MCLVLHLGMLLFTDDFFETGFRFSQYSILATDKRVEGPWVQAVTPPCFVMFPGNLCGFSFCHALQTSQHSGNFVFLPVPSNCQGVTNVFPLLLHLGCLSTCLLLTSIHLSFIENSVQKSQLSHLVPVWLWLIHCHPSLVYFFNEGLT